MAMVTPILLLILAGIFDFGFLFRGWEVVTNAAREGARVGILPDYECDPADTTDIQSRVDAYMAGAGITDPSSYSVTVLTGTVTTTGGDFAACSVRVSMTQQLPSLGVFGAFFGGSLTSVPVTAQAVMRIEGASIPGP